MLNLIRPTPDTCEVPVSGGLCGLDLKGGAILIALDGKRHKLCHDHMVSFFRLLVIGLEEASSG